MKIFAHNFVQKCNTEQTTDKTARRLTAYNVHESVATTTTSSLDLGQAALPAPQNFRDPYLILQTFELVNSINLLYILASRVACVTCKFRQILWPSSSHLCCTTEHRPRPTSKLIVGK